MSTEDMSTEDMSTEANSTNWKIGVGSLLLSLVIGWMSGLSAAPIAETLVIGLGVLLLAAMGVQAKLKEAEFKSAPIAATLLATIAVGLAIGLPVGIHMRTHQSLSPEPSHYIARFKGIDEKEILRALMRVEMGAVLEEKATGTPQKLSGTVLSGSIPTQSCEKLLEKGQNITGEDLLTSGEPIFSALSALVEPNTRKEALYGVVQKICLASNGIPTRQ